MIGEAVKKLKEGKIIIFPTDTIYGIGCSIDNQESINKLYKLRKTPINKPTLILAANKEQAFEYGLFTEALKRLTSKFWPGPLTIIVKPKPKMPKTIRGKKDSIAIRVPNQPPLRKIIERNSRPILAPSANFHGKKPPSNFDEIDKKLLALVDYAIDLSKLDDFVRMTQKASTVIDLTKRPFRILRSGTISRQEIQEAWEESEK